MQRTGAGEMATHHRANPKKTFRFRRKQTSKKKFLLPLPTNRPEKKFCCCHKNIGYLNVKNVSLSLVSSQQATTLAVAVAVRDVASVAYSFSPRGTLPALPAHRRKLRTLALDAQTLPRSI